MLQKLSNSRGECSNRAIKGADTSTSLFLFFEQQSDKQQTHKEGMLDTNEIKHVPLHNLTRGPLHLPSTKYMQMQMIDRLTCGQINDTPLA
jgi:hypothetical protein